MVLRKAYVRGHAHRARHGNCGAEQTDQGCREERLEGRYRREPVSPSAVRSLPLSR